jgi:hypothetical protein
LLAPFCHITARVDRRETIYESDEDRAAFLEIFRAIIADFAWR